MFDAIQSFDLTVLSWLRAYHDPAIVWAAWAVSTVAWKGWLWWVVIIGSWLRGQKTFAAEVGAALLIATVAGLPLKSVIARPRPDLFASQQLNIPMPELLSTTHSFPSGHTLLAAAFAFVVVARFPDYRAALAFLFVALVGVARVYQGMHWPSDVAGSIVLGGLAAAAAIRLCRLPQVRRFTEPKSSNAQAVTAPKAGLQPTGKP